MNELDTAISLLRELNLDKLRILIPSDHPRIEVAIRVLEAARFMQPEDITWFRHQVDRIEEYSPLPGCVCPGSSRKDRFRALIEALSEGEAYLGERINNRKIKEIAATILQEAAMPVKEKHE